MSITPEQLTSHVQKSHVRCNRAKESASTNESIQHREQTIKQGKTCTGSSTKPTAPTQLVVPYTCSVAHLLVQTPSLATQTKNPPCHNQQAQSTDLNVLPKVFYARSPTICSQRATMQPQNILSKGPFLAQRRQSKQPHKANTVHTPPGPLFKYKIAPSGGWESAVAAVCQLCHGDKATATSKLAPGC